MLIFALTNLILILWGTPFLTSALNYGKKLPEDVKLAENVDIYFFKV